MHVTIHPSVKFRPKYFIIFLGPDNEIGNYLYVAKGCSPIVKYEWSPVILRKSWRVPHVGQEMLILSGTPDFTPFGEFMISPIHYIYIKYYWICQSWDYVYGLVTGLFAWISLAALSRTYLLYISHDDTSQPWSTCKALDHIALGRGWPRTPALVWDACHHLESGTPVITWSLGRLSSLMGRLSGTPVITHHSGPDDQLVTYSLPMHKDELRHHNSYDILMI